MKDNAETPQIEVRHKFKNNESILAAIDLTALSASDGVLVPFAGILVPLTGTNVPMILFARLRVYQA
jgi:hypothetical protein